jgi:hypothetical protein
MALENGLRVKYPRQDGPFGMINMFTCTLNGMDLYDLKFEYVHGTKVKLVKEYNNIYCDQLIDLFESATGLYLTL